MIILDKIIVNENMVNGEKEITVATIFSNKRCQMTVLHDVPSAENIGRLLIELGENILNDVNLV